MVVLNLSYLEHLLIVRSQKHGWSVGCICGWKWLNHAGGLGIVTERPDVQATAQEIWIMQHYLEVTEPGFVPSRYPGVARYSA